MMSPARCCGRARASEPRVRRRGAPLRATIAAADAAGRAFMRWAARHGALSPWMRRAIRSPGISSRC